MPGTDSSNAVRRSSVTAIARHGVHAPGAPGRWMIDASRSNLQISVKVGMLATVRGRFTEVCGHVDLTESHLDSRISVMVPTTSLTSGNSHWDALLLTAGLVDTAANPTIAFQSTDVRTQGDGWELDGQLVTGRGCLPVTFALFGGSSDRCDRIRFRATGNVRSKDAVRLLSQPGVERIIGKTMGIDLSVEAVRA